MSTKGRKPVSKRRSPQLNIDDVFKNKLVIPEEIKADLDKRGLVGRFVDAKQLKENDGYHARGWTPYIRPTGVEDVKGGFRFGNDPDGLVRRGSVVLAYKTKGEIEKHRRFLAERSGKTKSFDSDKATEIKQMAEESGGDITIVEGYDENE